MTTQQMYKEIAGIMRGSLIPFDKDNHYNKVIHPLICNRLADYFEREEIKSYADNWTFKQAVKLKKTKFNRQQFLKMCGLK